LIITNLDKTELDPGEQPERNIFIEKVIPEQNIDLHVIVIREELSVTLTTLSIEQDHKSD